MRVALPCLFLSSKSYINSAGMVSTRRSLVVAAAAAAAAPAAAAPASKRASISDTHGDDSIPTDDSSSAVPAPVVKRAKQKNSISLATATPPPPRNEMTNGNKKLVLFSLQEDNNEPLVAAKLLRRPSQRNRSPYVADIELLLDDGRQQAICHVPSLDMGGKCAPGSKLLVRAARDPKTGQKVSANAVSQKYGTPKCEFISQLLYVDESCYHQTNSNDSNNDDSSTVATMMLYPPTWIGAHPSLGERISEMWFRQNLVEGIPPVMNIQTQVHIVADMRCDFVLTFANGEKCIVEVKTVVDTDYSVLAPPPTSASLKCRFISHTVPYTRTAIFPWGKSNQKGPNGEKVVSARAIKHVRTLTKIARKELLVPTAAADDDPTVVYKTAVLFVVVRGDAQAFRPNYQACPSFCRYLKEARDAGVQVLAKRVSWDEHGVCYNDDDDQMLPIDWEWEVQPK